MVGWKGKKMRIFVIYQCKICEGMVFSLAKPINMLIYPELDTIFYKRTDVMNCILEEAK